MSDLWFHLKVYLHESRKLRREHPTAFDVRILASSLRPWLRALRCFISPLDAGAPWLTLAAVRFLDRTVKPTMRVYEFGGGGSTVYLARRVAEVRVVEHNPDWHQKLWDRLQRLGLANATVQLAAPRPQPGIPPGDPADPNAYATDDDATRACSYRSYAESIDVYPDAHFDLILIDGRARPSCAKHAVSKLKEGGWIMLDNAERPHYRTIHEMFSGPGWIKTDLTGPGLGSMAFWQTCAWRKRSP